ncbi:MAG: deoxyribose-phosphate aldolase [Bacteroidales bacterium]|jgi:deoxyribose-phosphate aldolase|nr:deoxyribose-phosphate aldolase [Bacteroidales bacterium]
MEYTDVITERELKFKIEDLKNQISSNKNSEILQTILNLIDLTSLSGDDTIENIKSMTEKVNNFNDKFPKYKNVAAICVYPALVETVKKNITVNNINIAAVGAGFPASQTFLSIKLAECKLCINKGADEIDIVISIGRFLSENYDFIAKEVALIKQVIGDKHLKVILETGNLKTLKNIKIASILAIESGADFIKTSTGKTDISATPEAVYVMCQTIKEYFEKTGIKIGIKPSGGIRTADEAILYFLIVKNVLGKDWLNNKLFRFGASSLANNILSELENTPIKYF